MNTLRNWCIFEYVCFRQIWKWFVFFPKIFINHSWNLLLIDQLTLYFITWLCIEMVDGVHLFATRIMMLSEKLSLPTSASCFANKIIYWKRTNLNSGVECFISFPYAACILSIYIDGKFGGEGSDFIEKIPLCWKQHIKIYQKAK